MSYKVMGKDWECKNQCESNCCSEIFLDLPPAYHQSFEKEGYFIVGNNYTEFDWLEFHEGLKIEKLPKGNRKISIKEGVKSEVIFNPFRGYNMLHVLTPCNKLEPDGRCKIYRARPKICATSLCPVFTDKPTIMWFAAAGLLKDVRQKYEDTE